MFFEGYAQDIRNLQQNILKLQDLSYQNWAIS